MPWTMFSTLLEELPPCTRCRGKGLIEEDARPEHGGGSLRASCQTLHCLRREIFYAGSLEREAKLAELRSWWAWRVESETMACAS